MKKRMVCMLLAAVTLFALVTGCGNKATGSTAASGAASENSQTGNKPAEGATVLKMWVPPFGSKDSLDMQLWEDILAPFEQEHNVKFEVEVVPWSNYDEKYMTGITSGNGPDIGYMYFEQIADYIEMDAVAPMDSYITEADKKLYLHLNKGVINGKQYMFPFVVGSARIMVGNMDILKTAGVDAMPVTWDDFVAVCLKIKETQPDIIPFSQGWGGTSIGELNNVFYPYLWQAGGELFDKDNNLIVDSEAGLRAAQFVYDLRFTHKIMPETITSYTGDDCKNDFIDGKMAFTILSTRDAQDLKDVNWDFVVSLKDKQQATFAACDSFVLINGSKNQDLAMEAIKFITSKEQMKKFHTFAPFSPLTTDAEYLDDPKFEDLYMKQSDVLHVLPAVKGSHRTFDFLLKNLQAMMMGEKTPETALKEAVEYSKLKD